MPLLNPLAAMFVSCRKELGVTTGTWMTGAVRKGVCARKSCSAGIGVPALSYL